MWSYMEQRMSTSMAFEDSLVSRDLTTVTLIWSIAFSQSPWHEKDVHNIRLKKISCKQVNLFSLSIINFI